MCSSAVVSDKSKVSPAVPRFGSERCICTLELATSISGLQGVFLGRGSAIVTVSPDLHLFH